MSKKRIRVNPSLSLEEHEKLDKLAVAIGLTKTEMARQLIAFCLNNASIVQHVQDSYAATARFRIIPSTVDNELKYIYAEKKPPRK